MALYGIGDLHLSLSVKKPMDVFGGVWDGYLEKLQKSLSILQPEDTLVIAGDISWGMNLEEAKADLEFLHALPGRKILAKGNHDYWWNTTGKMKGFFAEHGFTSLEILHNNCHFYGEIAICGTRGWFYEETGNAKVFRRELMRLETSLKAAGEREKICFLHYPPCYQGYVCKEIMQILEQYQVQHCYYGHLHGGSHRLAVEETINGVCYHLISADYLNFAPVKIIP